jgi:hypothetical protein
VPKDVPAHLPQTAFLHARQIGCLHSFFFHIRPSGLQNTRDPRRCLSAFNAAIASSPSGTSLSDDDIAHPSPRRFVMRSLMP